MNLIAKINGFERADNGVYQQANAARSFAYSDGQASEQYLAQVFESAKDLSSNSPELDSKIIDWPSEYHLSSTRANLLRPLNLQGIKNVLELGCGCGSITRYLGEHSQLQVDGVEGSPARAALAALRCAELPNVSISTANFNQMKLPESHYDLILLVGVTEYAGRFSERDTDQQALQDLLSLAQKASTASGAIVIAIENRTGLKYLQGACEDHYGLAYVGLDDYPQSTGIRTYTKQQWQEQLQSAGFSAQQFAYPLPDYKIPTLLISDNAIQQSPVKELEQVLAKVKSRCYSSDFDLGEQEARLWQGVLHAGTFAEHANSFLILTGDDQDTLNRLGDFTTTAFATTPPSYLNKPHRNELGISTGARVANLLRRIIAKLQWRR